MPLSLIPRRSIRIRPTLRKPARRRSPMARRHAEARPVEAARPIGDALAATNRRDRDARRLELLEQYWAAAESLWPQLQATSCALPPLTGDALEAAKAALDLAMEVRPRTTRARARGEPARAVRRQPAPGQAPPPLPPGDGAHPHRQLHVLRADPAAHVARRAPDLRVARERGLHQRNVAGEPDGTTPERAYCGRCCSRSRIPTGSCPASSDRARLRTGARALGEAHRRRAGAPDGEGRRDRPVGHDFHRSRRARAARSRAARSSSSRSISRSRSRSRCASSRRAANPERRRTRRGSRLRYLMLLKRLLRQWAIPPARQFNRLPSRAKVVMCTSSPACGSTAAAGMSGVAAPPTRCRRSRIAR